MYVVTGPIFRGESLKALNGRVLVPTEVYKAVYNPKLGQAGAYVAENADDAELREVSVAQLREESGIDAFPALPEVVKARAMDLPDPTGRGHRGACAVDACDGGGEGLRAAALASVRTALPRGLTCPRRKAWRLPASSSNAPRPSAGCPRATPSRPHGA